MQGPTQYLSNHANELLGWFRHYVTDKLFKEPCEPELNAFSQDGFTRLASLPPHAPPVGMPFSKARRLVPSAGAPCLRGAAVSSAARRRVFLPPKARHHYRPRPAPNPVAPLPLSNGPPGAYSPTSSGVYANAEQTHVQVHGGRVENGQVGASHPTFAIYSSTGTSGTRAPSVGKVPNADGKHSTNISFNSFAGTSHSVASPSIASQRAGFAQTPRNSPIGMPAHIKAAPHKTPAI